MPFDSDNVIDMYSRQYLPMCSGGAGNRVLNVQSEMSLWTDLNVLANGSVGCLISVSLSEISVEREPGRGHNPQGQVHGNASSGPWT